MQITSEFDVTESVDKVWEFFNNIPLVASCLPGADISNQVGDVKGRGQAALVVNAALAPHQSGTRVTVDQDLQLSGAAAQYGRGLVQDVTQVLLDEFAANMRSSLAALERGEAYVPGEARSASGIAIGLKALWMALRRVARRFFLPYKPASG